MSTATLDHASLPSRAGAPLHLTRRGRLTIFLAALVVVLAGVFLVFGGTSAATEHPDTTRTVLVGNGETLWDIAADAAGDGRTGAMLVEIERLNDLDSGMVMAGQRLQVPVGG